MANEKNYDRDDKKAAKARGENPDPITGAPGSHPAGTAAGGVAGAVAGAAAGTAVGGPLGGFVGGALGAVAGGAGGKAVAEEVNPTVEDAYWREHYSNEPYYDRNYSYDDYQPAYRTGYEGYSKYGNTGKSFDELEPALRRDYERTAGTSKLTWDNARHATQAAWSRLDRHLDRYLGYDVVDLSDNKIGTLECMWSDHTGEPAFVGVKTGWLFGKTHVVPADNVQVGVQDNRIRLPYAESKIKDAPAFESDCQMSPEKEEEVRRYYGIGDTRQNVSNREDTSTRQTQPGRSDAEKPTRATPEQATIQLSEEELKIGKRQVEIGGVRLRKIVRTEVVNQPVEVQREELVIERVPADQAHSGRQQAFNQQEVYIPLRREEVVVQKEARLREEVRARKAKQTDTQQVKEQVRKEDVEIEETGEARRSTRGPGATDRTGQGTSKPRSQRRHETK